MKLSATTLRNALIDYRAEYIRMQAEHPRIFINKDTYQVVKDIDDVLYEIEGNITEVMISPVTCKANV